MFTDNFAKALPFLSIGFSLEAAMKLSRGEKAASLPEARYVIAPNGKAVYVGPSWGGKFVAVHEGIYQLPNGDLYGVSK